MKLVIAADHAGFPLKEEVRAYLAKAGHEVVDLGAYNADLPDDYPDFAEKVGEAHQAGVAPRGILICGSGVGVCVAANKIPGIRAGMCHDTYSAHQGVEHDDMNVIVLGARIIGSALAFEWSMRLSAPSSSPTKSGSCGDSRRCWPSRPSIIAATARRVQLRTEQFEDRRIVGRSTRSSR